MSAPQWVGVLYAACGVGTLAATLLVEALGARTASPPMTWRGIARGMATRRALLLMAFALSLWPCFLALWVTDGKGWLR